MSRRLVACAAAVTALGLVVVPAHAAPKKRTITQTYSVTLPPDPTGNVGTDGCAGFLPGAQDRHAVTVPAKGTLKVHLSGEDPTGAGLLDWDLALLDADGTTRSQSASAGGEEEVFDKFKRKQKVLIQACNLSGLPNATVTWTFTYS